MNMKRIRLAGLVAFTVAAVGTARLQGQTWDGGSPTNEAWGQAANWVGDVLPAFDASTSITFNGTTSTARLSNVIGDNRTIGSLTFDQMTSNVSIGLSTTGLVARDLTLGNATLAPTITVLDSASNPSTVVHTIGATVGNVVLGNNLTIDVNGNPAGADATQLRIDRPITGSFGITKQGTGFVFLNATNTYTGKTAINGGRLRVADGNISGVGANPVSFVADQITIDNGSLYAQGVTAFGNRGVTLGAGGGGFLANNGGNMTVNVAIAGTGNLTQETFGQGYTLTLSANNTFSGSTRIASSANATMALTAINALQNSAIDTTNTVLGSTTAGFRVAYGANTALNIGGLIGNKDLSTIFRTDGNYGSVTAITLNTVDGKDVSYSGAIAGSRSLIKTGNGTQTFTGALSYTGATTVSAGTLLINGSYTGNGSISVASAGTLGGNGTIVGATTIAGALRPGNSPGLLTFNGSLTLEDSTITTMEINGTSRGSTFDAVDVVGTTGALTYNGTMNLAVGTTFTAGNYTFDLYDFTSQSDSFDFVSLTGNYTGNFTNALGVWTTTTNSGAETWTFSQDTGVLNLVVVPEPSTMALVAIGITGLWLASVTRRRSAKRRAMEGAPSTISAARTCSAV